MTNDPTLRHGPVFIGTWLRNIMRGFASQPAQQAPSVVSGETQFEVWQDGGAVGWSDTLSDAQHYAAIYGQDGPVEIMVAVTKRVPLDQWPALSARVDPEPCPECAAVSSAIGTVRYMDPPDGGDVSLAEQVRRMSARIDTLTAQLDRAREALRELQGRLSDCIKATERCGDADINVGRVQAYRLALSSSEQVAATLEQPHE